MSGWSAKLVAVVFIAAAVIAISGCKEQPAAGATAVLGNSEPVSKVIGRTDLPKDGIGGDIAILLNEDQAALEAVIERLKNRPARKPPSNSETGKRHD